MSQRDALPDDPRIAGSDAMTATARLHEVVIALEEMDKRAELLRAERNQLLYLAMTNEAAPSVPQPNSARSAQATRTASVCTKAIRPPAH